VLGVGCWVLGVGGWVLGINYWLLVIGYWGIGYQLGGVLRGKEIFFRMGSIINYPLSIIH
jgi:hypothetical protein